MMTKRIKLPKYSRTENLDPLSWLSTKFKIQFFYILYKLLISNNYNELGQIFIISLEPN